MHGSLKVVILQKTRKDMMKLLLIWQLVSYGRLSLVKFRRSNHLHCRSDLQRILHRRNPALYFLQRRHYLKPLTIELASFSIIAVITSSILPSDNGSSTSVAWNALILLRNAVWKSFTRETGRSFRSPFVPQ